MRLRIWHTLIFCYIRAYRRDGLEFGFQYFFYVFQKNEYFGGYEDFCGSSLNWTILGLISIFYDIFVTLRYRMGIFLGVCLDPVYIVILGPGVC